MALYQLISEISAGPYTFQGAHEVRIKRSIHTLADSAVVTLPAFVNVVKDGKVVNNNVSTRTLFTDNDTISINLGYTQDGSRSGLNNEFTGFIKSRGLGMPMVMECEGYARQLRLNVDINANFTNGHNTSAKALLGLATQGTDVTVLCPVDFPISAVNLVNQNGVTICDFIKEASDNALSIYFKEPKTLWCGIVYTNYANGTNVLSNDTVKYSIGVNCLRDNALKMRIPSEPVQVIINGKLASGMKLSTASRNKAAQNKYKLLLSHVPSQDALATFAQEKEYRLNYTGYEGKLTAFLQPYCDIGMSAYIIDNRNTNMTGTYIIEAMEVTYGMGGARRIIDIGPKLNFGSTQQ